MVQSVAEPLAPQARFLHDLSTLACFALLAVPLYFVLNDYWQSLLRLGGLYVALGIFCVRLGHYMRRVMRREPAEIPPWEAPLPVSQTLLGLEPHVQATEAIQNVYTDPHYLQEVLKPRLQHVLVYRVWGMPNGSFETLQEADWRKWTRRSCSFCNGASAPGCGPGMSIVSTVSRTCLRLYNA